MKEEKRNEVIGEILGKLGLKIEIEEKNKMRGEKK